MKRTLIAFLMISITFQAFSQLVVGEKEDLDRFKKTKTIVFLEKNPLLMYNKVIKTTVEKHWKITPYEFKTFSDEEFEQLRRKNDLSFLMINIAYFRKDKTQAQYQFLNASLGGDYDLVKNMPTLSGLPISYVDVPEDTYDYKLGLILRFIQEHIKVCSEHPELTNSKKAINYYRKKLTTIHDKTLYVLKEELGPNVNSIKKIKEVYPFEVKIVSREEITEIIDKQDPNAVILHQVGPTKKNRKARCWNVIMGASDAKLYYFNYHMISKKKPEGLLKKDFKKLSKNK